MCGRLPVAQLHGRAAGHDHVGRHVLRHDRARGDDRAVAHRHLGLHDRAVADPGVVAR